MHEYEDDRIGFRIPLQCGDIDLITRHKLRKGCSALILAAVAIIAVIPMTIVLFATDKPQLGFSSVGLLAVILLLGTGLFRDALPLLNWKYPVGYVFLSWTIRNPRDNAAMRPIIYALKKLNVEFYDYTRFQVDDSNDRSEEIGRLLETAIANCDLSIEIISQDILFHEWVQHERAILRKSKKNRVFLCIDWGFLFCVGKNEEDITRLNFSDGRFGGNAIEDLARYSNVRYFEGRKYQLKCLFLVAVIRFSIVTGRWGFLRSIMNNAKSRG